MSSAVLALGGAEVKREGASKLTFPLPSPTLPRLVQKFVPEAMGREIEKAARGIYPLSNVMTRKCKSESRSCVVSSSRPFGLLTALSTAFARHHQFSRPPSTILRSSLRCTERLPTRLDRRSEGYVASLFRFPCSRRPC